jgi:uncharacterized membrane protein YqaE (UPF0057 family)
MRTLIAVIFPSLAFLLIGRPLSAILCFILQCTVIGWLPAAIWAAVSVSQHKTEKTLAALIREQNLR